MTFSKIRPGGFAANSKLFSSEMTALDTDHANAVDKTGDSITGNVHVAASGAITVDNNGTVTFALGSTVNAQTNAWTFSVAQPLFTAGAAFTTAGNVAVTTGVTLLLNGGVALTLGGGRYQLGDNDYPVLSAPHTGTTQLRMIPLDGLASVVAYNSGLVGVGLIIRAAGDIVKMSIPSMWNGATLNAVTAFFTPVNTHTALPIAPSMNVRRKKIAVGANTAYDDLGVLSQPATLPGTSALWNDGTIKSWAYACTVNNVIDTTKYVYWIEIADESGANAKIGTNYYSALFTYTIADLRPQ